jgi:hypothetical protein
LGWSRITLERKILREAEEVLIPVGILLSKSV